MNSITFVDKRRLILIVPSNGAVSKNTWWCGVRSACL